MDVGRRAVRAEWVIAAMVVAALAGCGRPTGDFGRARPSVIHDRLLPAAGRYVAEADRFENTSDFVLTDDEGELRARSFAFVRAPHVRDWWFDTLTEAERTRILPALDTWPSPAEPGFPLYVQQHFYLPAIEPAFDVTRFYAFLRTDPDVSSETRWTRLREAMTGDAMLVPPFCAVAAKVRTTDTERIAALERQGDALETGFVDDAYERVEENEGVMSWVWRALAYRLRSYRYAIDHLTVETPSDQLWEVNRAYDALAATRCEAAAPRRGVLRWADARHSRLLKGPDPFDQPVLQK